MPSFGDEPNVHTCPVCLGHPGSLPTINEQAIRYALMIAAALECDVAPRSIFHRKNYFYPDLPKGYQISQYDEPLAVNGRLGDVRIHRAHLEEDAADDPRGRIGPDPRLRCLLVDFNRARDALVEIVTEPDLHSPHEAREWAQLLRTTIRLGVSDVNMEEGSLRVDANVSIRPADSDELGTKTELKNMNSFRFLERASRRRSPASAGCWRAGRRSSRTRSTSIPRTALGRRLPQGVRPRLPLLPELDLVPVVPTDEMLRRRESRCPSCPRRGAALPDRNRTFG